MIKRKSAEEIKIMLECGEISTGALKEVLANVKTGISTLELNEIAEEYILKNGGECSFKSVDDYKYGTCINVNEGLVHGLPSEYVIKKGDIVSVDLGAYYKGFHTDLSYTVEVETNKESVFLQVGKDSLQAGISQCTVGKRIGDIGYAMQKVVEDAGFTVSRELVGHGIGRKLHEDPYVPGYGDADTGLKLREGMVFAIEIIYQKGLPFIKIAEDDWTIETSDGSLGGLFEKTVAVTKSGPTIVTNY